jgi:hypothetical protein
MSSICLKYSDSKPVPLEVEYYGEDVPFEKVAAFIEACKKIGREYNLDSLSVRKSRGYSLKLKQGENYLDSFYNNKGEYETEKALSANSSESIQLFEEISRKLGFNPTPLLELKITSMIQALPQMFLSEYHHTFSKELELRDVHEVEVYLQLPKDLAVGNYAHIQLLPSPKGNHKVEITFEKVSREFVGSLSRIKYNNTLVWDDPWNEVAKWSKVLGLLFKKVSGDVKLLDFEASMNRHYRRYFTEVRVAGYSKSIDHAEDLTDEDVVFEYVFNRNDYETCEGDCTTVLAWLKSSELKKILNDRFYTYALNLHKQ